jgi:hypothetical protein
MLASHPPGCRKLRRRQCQGDRTWLPRDALTDNERAAVEDFSSQMREIKRIKEKRRG